MKRIRSTFLIAFALVGVLILNGCLQSEKTVTIRPDGSGTVEERFLMRSEFVQMIAGMAAGATGEEFNLLDREELQAQAQKMGSGVTFESVEPLQTEWGEGYVATYRFEDVSELRINQNPGDNVPSQGPAAAPDTETTEYLEFSFSPGNPAELQVTMPDSSDGDGGASSGSDAAGESSGMEAAQFEEVKQIYQDMKIVLRLRFDGNIVSTNATHRDGNTVTLMNMDFNKILAEPETARKLMSQQTDSLAEVQRALQDFEGIQAEFKRNISVRFR